MKEILLICLLLLGMVPGGNAAEPVILVANSIDKGLNSDFISFVQAERDVKLVTASEFENYKKSTYIAIIGGNKAPEGVGDIVEKVLSEQEKTEISTKGKMVIKLNVWQEGQVVVFLAGPDREKTKSVCQENKKAYTSLLKGVETLRGGILTPDHAMIAFLWPQPLSSSDRLSPYAPTELPQTVVDLPYLVPYPLKESCWFFWIDDVPYAKYVHATRFVLFGIDSGEPAVHHEEWWPVLNGTSLWVDKNEYWNKFYHVYNPGLQRSKPSVFYYGAEVTVYEQPGPRANALVVNGWNEGESHKEDMAEDEKAMKAALENAGLAVQGARTVGEVEATLKKWAREMKSDDAFILYITAHGGVGYVVIGGKKFSVADLAALLGNFEQNVYISLVVDACYSGSFIADGTKAKAIFIATSTSTSKCAFGDWDPENDPNPSDQGSEFTSGFTEALYLLRGNVLTSPKDTRIRFSPKDVYGRISSRIEEIVKGAVGLDAGAINGLSSPQLWTQATGGEDTTPDEPYT